MPDFLDERRGILRKLEEAPSSKKRALELVGRRIGSIVSGIRARIHKPTGIKKGHMAVTIGIAVGLAATTSLIKILREPSPPYIKIGEIKITKPNVPQETQPQTESSEAPGASKTPTRKEEAPAEQPTEEGIKLTLQRKEGDSLQIDVMDDPFSKKGGALTWNILRIAGDDLAGYRVEIEFRKADAEDQIEKAMVTLYFRSLNEPLTISPEVLVWQK